MRANASSTAATYFLRNRAISTDASISRTWRVFGPPGTERGRVAERGAEHVAERVRRIGGDEQHPPVAAARSSAAAAAHVDLPTPPLPPNRSQRALPSEIAFRLKAEATGRECRRHLPVPWLPPLGGRRRVGRADAPRERRRRCRRAPGVNQLARAAEHLDAARLAGQLRKRNHLQAGEPPRDRAPARAPRSAGAPRTSSQRVAEAAA